MSETAYDVDQFCDESGADLVRGLNLLDVFDHALNLGRNLVAGVVVEFAENVGATGVHTATRGIRYHTRGIRYHITMADNGESLKLQSRPCTHTQREQTMPVPVHLSP